MLASWFMSLTILAAPVPVVVIDAGHGGGQTGAYGVCGVHEKDVTLAIAVELAHVLDASGRAKAVMTRAGDEDISLEERSQRANRADASLLLSIHANASTSASSRGVETFFLSRRASERRHHDLVLRENDGRPSESVRTDDTLGVILNGLRLSAAHTESQQLAMRLQEVLHERLGTRGRGVLQAPFIVLRDAQMAAALVEVGFLTNLEECRLLNSVDYQRQIAQALATATLAHLGVQTAVLARQ